MEAFARFIRGEDGQGMTEYGLILAGIATVAIATMAVFNPGIQNGFQAVVTRITAVLK